MICANCHSEDVTFTEIPYKGWTVVHKFCNICQCRNIIDDKLLIRKLKLDKIIKEI